jgi:hypothetical protein
MMLRLTYRSGTGLNDWSHSAILGDRGVAARNFADLVAARMIGTVLPFSERESLVRAAARSGINRFEANLLIAAVQHQLGVGLKRQGKDGLLVSSGASARSAFLAVCGKIGAAMRDFWQMGRRWAISKQLWPMFRFSPALKAKLIWIGAVIRNQWELTREWAIEKKVWPSFLSSSAVITVLPAANVRISPVMRERPGIVRRREPVRGPVRVRISSAIATFVAVQAGIIAAVWYLFAY